MAKRKPVLSMIWRKRRWILWGMVFALGAWCALNLLAMWQIDNNRTIDQRDETDVIVVLGAGVNRNGGAGFALTRRSQRGVQLWRDGVAPYILCTGGHAPYRPNSEAIACRDVLLREGIPNEVIFLEDRSRSTEENAIYSREIMQEQSWQTATVVTDSFHIFRAGVIFNHYGIEHTKSAVPAELIRGYPTYQAGASRELLALNWFHFKNFFRIDLTYIP